jgi:hypothetical protein
MIFVMLLRMGRYHILIRSEVMLYYLVYVAEVLRGDAELLNLVKHMRAYPTDSLEDAFRNIFDFDIYRSETMTTLYDILRHHG